MRSDGCWIACLDEKAFSWLESMDVEAEEWDSADVMSESCTLADDRGHQDTSALLARTITLDGPVSASAAF